MSSFPAEVLQTPEVTEVFDLCRQLQTLLQFFILATGVTLRHLVAVTTTLVIFLPVLLCVLFSTTGSGPSELTRLKTRLNLDLQSSEQNSICWFPYTDVTDVLQRSLQ